MTLYEKLEQNAGAGRLAMHMPGHKRNAGAFPWLKGLCERDVTEIEGFDDLNDPEGLFLALEGRIARLWGAYDSVALVGGSTLGILASVLGVLEGGGELLMCRASHRSVYHAAELADVQTRYLTPETDPELGVPLSTTPGEVAEALDARPGVGLVCVTSPTYEGVISDIAAIAHVCHERGVPLLVDEAHGAHLGFGPFPASAVAAGADLVVQSLHKTLPALTQTAVLHIRPGLVDPAKIRRRVGMLQTSSPSYLLSGSIDACTAWLEANGDSAAKSWYAALCEFREGAKALGHIRLWEGRRGVHALDPSKLLLASAPALGPGLRASGIEPEYVRGGLTLCMTGMGDTRESLGRLLDALLSLDRDLPSPRSAARATAPLPRQVMTLRRAMSAPGRLLPLSAAVGHVSGEYAWAYPPGVPRLVPGEIIDEGVAEALKASDSLHFTHKHGPDSIFCVDLPGKIV